MMSKPKAQTKLEKAYEDKIERLEALLADKDDLINRLRTDKNNLIEAMRKLEVDGKQVGVGFKSASLMQAGEIKALSVSIKGEQGAEIFMKARELVKLRNNPNSRIVLTQKDDKLDIEVRSDKK